MQQFNVDQATDGISARSSLLHDRAIFFDLSLDLMCTAGLDGYFREMSPSWETTLGYTLDELRAVPFGDFIHPADQESTALALADLGRGVNLTSFKNRYRRRDGAYLRIEWTATAMPERGVVYAVGRDVTSRDEADAALRAAHARIQHLLRSCRVAFFASKPAPEGVVSSVYMSENVRELFGYEADEYLADPNFWRRRVHPDDEERIDADLSRMLERERQVFEYRFQRSDGVYRWVLGDARILRDERGQPMEVVGTWQDITDRKEAEQTIRQQASALLELSTPLIPISDDVLVMPLIGVVDSRRAAQVLDTLLQGISERGASAAILDITGVGVVDTKVADTLLRAARAVQLLGAEVVLTGIRPDVAQTLVGLGADLAGIVTCGTLQAGIRHAMRSRASSGRKAPAFHRG